MGTRQSVVACCTRCGSEGVTPGMTLAHARALIPACDMIIDTHDADRAARALRQLALWLAALAPVVALDPPDALLMDISGCERLYATDERYARRIGRAVWSLGLHCRVAVAPTFAGAGALARFAPRPLTITTAQQMHGAIGPLPIAALGIAAGVAAALNEVGVHSIAELLGLPRVSLASRFGGEVALRMDQIFGHAMEVIEPVRPTPALRAERFFEGGTTRLEGLRCAFTGLLEELTRTLEARARGVRVLLAECARIGSPPVAFTITLSRPSRTIKHLRALLFRKLDTLNMGFGVEGVSLTALRTGRLAPTQHAVWNAKDNTARAGLAELVDTLADRLGAQAVAWLDPIDSHIPEKAFRSRAALDSLRAPGATIADAPRERPSLLLVQPEPAPVISLVPDGPPVRLEWRARTHTIISGIGPERIAPEWWLARSGTREYYRVQTDSGLWLWVFRELETAMWHVHGIWA